MSPQTFSPTSSSSEPPLLLCFPFCRRRTTLPLAAALPPSASCYRPSPRVTPTLPAALAFPCCPASRVPRPPRAPAGRHLTAIVIPARACLISLSLLLSTISNWYSFLLHSKFPCRKPPELPSPPPPDLLPR
jgi:hypothetical protein